MSYQSIREKIRVFTEDKLLPVLRERDLDYNEVIKVIIENIGCSQSMAEEGIRVLINMNKIKEIRILTIMDEEVSNWLDDLKEQEVEQKKANEVIEEIEKGVVDG